MGPFRGLTQWIKGPFPIDKSSPDVLIATDHHLIPSFIVLGAILPAPICITNVELMKEGLVFLPCIYVVRILSLYMLMSTSLVAFIMR
jgi:hypothetical protein